MIKSVTLKFYFLVYGLVIQTMDKNFIDKLLELSMNIKHECQGFLIFSLCCNFKQHQTTFD